MTNDVQVVSLCVFYFITTVKIRKISGISACTKYDYFFQELFFVSSVILLYKIGIRLRNQIDWFIIDFHMINFDWLSYDQSINFNWLIVITDKETDESWDIFIIWKINSGLVWAAGPVLWKKSLGPIMINFWGLFFKFSWAKNKFKIFLKIL